MERRARYGVVLALFLLAAAGSLVIRPGKSEEKHSLSFPVMGTVASLTLYTDETTFKHAAALVRAQFDLVCRMADLHCETSEISRLNRSAAEKPFVCSPGLWEILCEARLAHKLSEGAFDISVKPLMDHWGFYRKKKKDIPPLQKTVQIKSLTGLEKITFNDLDHSVRFPRQGFALDLGGIAKGYAIETACRALADLGIRRGVIDLGGNLRLLPEPPPGKKYYSIGIRRPAGKNGSIMPEILHLPGNCAVSSSGDYERYVKIKGKIFGHIIDPATGIPAPGRRAVTAVSTAGTRSDWLSTAVYLRGEKLARKLKNELADTHFYIIEKENF